MGLICISGNGNLRSQLAIDLDGDGHLDLIVAGNTFESEANTPRADAGNGLFLKGEADMVLSYTTSPAYHTAIEKKTLPNGWSTESGA